MTLASEFSSTGIIFLSLIILFRLETTVRNHIYISSTYWPLRSPSSHCWWRRRRRRRSSYYLFIRFHSTCVPFEFYPWPGSITVKLSERGVFQECLRPRRTQTEYCADVLDSGHVYDKGGLKFSQSLFLSYFIPLLLMTVCQDGNSLAHGFSCTGYEANRTRGTAEWYINRGWKATRRVSQTLVGKRTEVKRREVAFL